MPKKYRDATTAGRVRDLMVYDPDTGYLGWRHRRAGQRPPGSHAGYVGKDGYWKIRLDGNTYQAHRLIWLYMMGVWPPNEVDHINLEKSDNRWSNLRAATHAHNMVNVRARKTATSDSQLKGVYRDKRHSTVRWFSQIRINKKQVRLGTFATEHEAHAAYCAAAIKCHGAFARTK